MKINKKILKSLVSHARSLDFRNFLLLSSMRYERCIEFPMIIEKLQPLFDKKLSYLDIGTGDSALPTYIYKNSSWDVTCVDKFNWVEMQNTFLKNINAGERKNNFKIIIQDFLNTDLPKESFDIITNISVIEHFEKNLDSIAMKKSAELLKKGGIYILTTPFNENHSKDFFVQRDSYGVKFKSEPVFFQRHYDSKSLKERIIEPSGLTEEERKYFGEYGFQFKETFLDLPKFLKPFKILYQWKAPYFAQAFASAEDHPVSRKNMRMYTSAGVFLVLKKQ